MWLVMSIFHNLKSQCFILHYTCDKLMQLCHLVVEMSHDMYIMHLKSMYALRFSTVSNFHARLSEVYVLVSVISKLVHMQPLGMYIL